MKRRTHAITPTDIAPAAGKDWRHSKPSRWFPMRCADGVVRECIELDAFHAITLPAQHQAAADEANKKLRGWGTKR